MYRCRSSLELVAWKSLLLVQLIHVWRHLVDPFEGPLSPTQAYRPRLATHMIMSLESAQATVSQSISLTQHTEFGIRQD